MRLLPILVLAACLGGCASPYARFYQAAPNAPAVVPQPNNTPVLVNGTRPQDDRVKFAEDGYVGLGFSQFTAGGGVNQESALEQGRRVGADLVAIYSAYLGSSTAYAPFTTPTSTSVNTFYSGSYGYGSATSTINGSKTTYIPITSSTYEYLATYWVKGPPPVLGVMTSELTPEQRRAYETNSGAMVIAVLKGSPAFRADILNGDLIKKIGDTAVSGPAELTVATGRLRGQKVDVTLLRNGAEKVIAVQLNP